MKRFCAYMYATAMLVAVLFFEYFVSSFELGVLIVPYFVVIVCAALFASLLSDWYKSSQRYFGLVAVPVCVGILSPLVAGQMFALAMFMSMPETGFSISSFFTGIYASVVFILYTSPVLVLGLCLASFGTHRFLNRTGESNAT